MKRLVRIADDEYNLNFSELPKDLQDKAIKIYRDNYCGKNGTFDEDICELIYDFMQKLVPFEYSGITIYPNKYICSVEIVGNFDIREVLEIMNRKLTPKETDVIEKYYDNINTIYFDNENCYDNCWNMWFHKDEEILSSNETIKNIITEIYEYCTKLFNKIVEKIKIEYERLAENLLSDKSISSYLENCCMFSENGDYI